MPGANAPSGKRVRNRERTRVALADDYPNLCVLAIVLDEPKMGGERISLELLKNEITYIPKRKAIQYRKEAKEYIDKNNLKDRAILYEFPAPNVAWSIDFKYIDTPWGREYLFKVIDDNSRKDLASLLVPFMTTQAAIATVKMAIHNTGRIPEIIKSDRGSQFQKQFAAFVEGLGVYHLKSIPYYPYCNAKIERLFLDVEKHVVSRITPFTSHAELLLMLAQETHLHNSIRSHLGIGGLTPDERYFGLEDKIIRRMDAFKSQYSTKSKKHKTWKMVPVSEFIPGAKCAHSVRVFY